MIEAKYRFARRALNAPDGESTQAEAGIMGVARQASAATTAGLVFELKAKGEEKGQDKLDKRLAIIKQTPFGRPIRPAQHTPWCHLHSRGIPASACRPDIPHRI